MASPSTAQVLVITKSKITEHKVVSIPATSLPPLQAGSIRVRARITSITATNLAYARLGTMMKWWNAYPVPSQLPAPYNDQSQYGICPSWGYAEILESKISGLDVRTLVHGYWPMSDLPFDLKLVPGDAPGHWKEVTEHRQDLMPLYNRYSVRDANLRWDEIEQSKLDALGWEAVVGVIWQCGFVLNKHVLGPPYIHPAGRDGPPDQPWNQEKGNLESAVVINLSAGGKTARSFSDSLINAREPGTGPLGLLAITGGNTRDLLPEASFPTKTIDYQSINQTESTDWLAKQKPSKIVIVDFGGRGDSYSDLVHTIEKHLPQAVIVAIGVGNEAKPMSPQEFSVWAQKNYMLAGRVQMNTSPVLDEILSNIGIEAYSKYSLEGWKGFLARGNLKNLRLVWGEGVEGENGMEGGWEQLCTEQMPSDVGQVYKM